MIKVRIKAHDVHNALLASKARKALRMVARTAVRDGLDVLAEEARLRAPVDSGTLRDSIEVVMGRGNFGEVVVGEHYAIFEEYGTTQRAARPFLRPAIDSAADRARAAARRVLEKG